MLTDGGEVERELDFAFIRVTVIHQNRVEKFIPLPRDVQGGRGLTDGGGGEEQQQTAPTCPTYICWVLLFTRDYIAICTLLPTQTYPT